MKQGQFRFAAPVNESYIGDRAISTAGYFSRDDDMVIREPASAYEVESEPTVRWPWQDELAAGEFSIRIPEPAGQARCGRCRTRFSAAGPTGFAEDVPICDLCLLENSPELGMVMAVVAVVRAFGTARPSSHEDYHEALYELGAFARIYDRFASKSGPARVFRIPSFEQ